MFLAPATDERSCALLPLHLITVGYDFQQRPVRRPNGAPFHHVFFVEQGEGVFETPDGIYTVGAGNAIFMRKGNAISYYQKSDELKTAWVTFDGPCVDNLLAYFHAGGFVFFESEEIHALIRGCYRSAERKSRPETLSKQAYDLIVTFFELLNQGQKPSALLGAKNYMEENYHLDLSVANIAEAVGVSESLLYRLFREGEGITPIDCLRRIRIGRAKQLLIECPTLLIGEIAAQCGFADSAYFCKVFKEQTDMTPRVYRSTYAL